MSRPSPLDRDRSPWWDLFLDVLPVLIVVALVVAGFFASGSADGGSGPWPLG